MMCKVSEQFRHPFTLAVIFQPFVSLIGMLYDPPRDKKKVIMHYETSVSSAVRGQQWVAVPLLLEFKFAA